MTISSRTPEGLPSRCPLCSAENEIEFSDVAGDAPCPNCGCMLWQSNQLLQSVIAHFKAAHGNKLAVINADSKLPEIAVSSLDMVELVMELEERFNLTISEVRAENVQTIGDFVRVIQDPAGDLDV